MKISELITAPTNSVEKHKVLKSLRASFKIENIEISEKEADRLYEKVQMRIKKQV